MAVRYMIDYIVKTLEMKLVIDGTNRNAVKMEDLAEATKLVASQSAQSGVAVNQMTAAVSTMIAVTQQGGDIAGRAFRGILMNLQQVSGETEDGDLLDEESFKKTEATLNKVGVAIEGVKNGVVSLRDPMVILQELAKVYNSLADTDPNKAAIISDLGGKYRGNQLAALLSNWDTYEKILSDYSNSSGSAMNEAMKSANNWEGSLNKLNNTFTSFVQNFVNSDMAISAINIADSFVGVAKSITDITSALGPLPTLLTSIAGIMSAKGMG